MWRHAEWTELLSCATARISHKVMVRRSPKKMNNSQLASERLKLKPDTSLDGECRVLLTELDDGMYVKGKITTGLKRRKQSRSSFPETLFSEEEWSHVSSCSLISMNLNRNKFALRFIDMQYITTCLFSYFSYDVLFRFTSFPWYLFAYWSTCFLTYFSDFLSFILTTLIHDLFIDWPTEKVYSRGCTRV